MVDRTIWNSCFGRFMTTVAFRVFGLRAPESLSGAGLPPSHMPPVVTDVCVGLIWLVPIELGLIN
jgi:hypothetical protein